MTLPFGENGERFESSLFLVLCNRLVTCCVAIVCLLVCTASPYLPDFYLTIAQPPLILLAAPCKVQVHRHIFCAAVLLMPELLLMPGLKSFKVCCSPVQWTEESIAPVAPAYAYAAVSLSNVVATTCQYEALKYVTFPLQTLGKTAKMIPVMLWGSIIGGKRCAAVMVSTVCRTQILFIWSCAI